MERIVALSTNDVALLLDLLGRHRHLLDRLTRLPVDRTAVGVARHLGRTDPLPTPRLIAGEFHFAQDHALIHEPLERLGTTHVAAVVEHLVPEPRVEQVQHGVLRAAHVQIDRHPGPFFRGIDKARVVPRIDEPQVVPAGAGPLRHRVGFALVPPPVDHRIEPRLRAPSSTAVRADRAVCSRPGAAGRPATRTVHGPQQAGRVARRRPIRAGSGTARPRTAGG